MNKRFLSFLSIIACLCLVFTFSVTPVKAETADSTENAETIAGFEGYMNEWINYWFAGDLSSLESYNQSYTAAGINVQYEVEESKYNEMIENAGMFQEYGNVTCTIDGDVITIKKGTVNAGRNVDFTFCYDQAIASVVWTVDVEATIGETFVKACLNTVMGMGIVFVVLIFISFIISLFGIFGNIKKKQAVATQSTVVEKEVVPELPADTAQSDDEIIAVIAAAIAAYEAESGGDVNVPADGLIVRSIRKRGFAN